MDVVQSAHMVIQIASGIYKIVDDVRSFKHRSKRLGDQIKGMMPAVEKLASSNQDISSLARTLDDIKLFSKSLGELRQLMKRIDKFLRSLQKMHFIKKVLFRGSINTEFEEYRELLSSLSRTIQLSISVEFREMLYPKMEDIRTRQIEDRQDQQNDFNELKDEIRRVPEKIDEINQKLIEAFLQAPIPEANDKETIAKRYGEDADVMMIKRNELSEMKYLSDGRFSKIFVAKYMQEKVAVKEYTTKDSDRETLKKVLLKEARNLRQLDSTHIVRLWGVCPDKDSYLLVFEYMARGNLRDVLDKVGGNMDELPLMTRIQMALDGAVGLFRMHNMQKPLLHQDIASDIFLVDDNWKMKISGLGFAQTQSSILKQSKATNTGRDTLNYICPERLQDSDNRPDSCGDVYSYGIVMWEIATGSKPYLGMNDDEIAIFVLRDKKKLPLPDNIPKEFTQLIDDCRNFDRLQRPSSLDIVTRLQKLKDSVEGH